MKQFRGTTLAYEMWLMKNPTLYEMLEDKSGTLLETLIYGSLLVSVVVSIVYAAVQPVIV